MYSNNKKKNKLKEEYTTERKKSKAYSSSRNATANTHRDRRTERERVIESERERINGECKIYVCFVFCGNGVYRTKYARMRMRMRMRVRIFKPIDSVVCKYIICIYHTSVLYVYIHRDSAFWLAFAAYAVLIHIGDEREVCIRGRACYFLCCLFQFRQFALVFVYSISVILPLLLP